MNYFSHELNEMRQSYSQPQKRLGKRPKRLKDFDPLNTVFIESDLIFKSGQIHYAAPVQANNILFNNFPRRDAHVLPILAAPHQSKNIIILPKSYWSKSFTKLYKTK